jgi:hypothetical protein
METISNHTTALFAPQNSASLPNTQPNSPSHSRGWRVLGFLPLVLISILLGGNAWGQISYSQNWSTTGLNSWTSQNGNFGRTNLAVCATTGSVRANIYNTIATGNFASPLLSGNNGGLVTVSYLYKVINYTGGAATPNTFGTLKVQYASALAGPWSDVPSSTVNSSNHNPSTSCATQVVQFTPALGNVYIRFNVAWSTGDYYMYFDDVSISQGSAPVNPEPTNQVTALAAGAVTTTAIPLTWTAAATGTQAPAGYLVKASATNLAAITDPVDGTDPADVTAFTSGSANKKQTTGAATSTTSFTSMTAGTMYYYKVYSYTNSGSSINFKTGSPATLNHATLPDPATSSVFSSTTGTTTTLGWTLPASYSSANHSTLVFIKSGSAVTVGTPTNAPSTYTANTVFGSGTAYQGDANAKCVYNGDATSVSISGLSGSTTYHVLVLIVVDAQNSNSTCSYSSSLTGNVTTVKPEPTNQVTNLAAGTVTTTAIPLTWTAAVTGTQAPDGYLVKASATNLAAIADPVDGTDPADVTAFTSGSANKKQTTGAATSTTTFTGTSVGTMYYYKVYSYTNSGSSINFKTDLPATLNHATLPNAATAAGFTSTTGTSTVISWTAPVSYSSANHSTLVFVKSGSAVTAGTPTNDPTSYTASANFGSPGTAYQGDAAAYCVYNGDANTVTVTGLSASTTYHIYILSVVDAGNSNGTRSYSAGLTGNFTTACSTASLPWSENFDAMSSIGSAVVPTCWLNQTGTKPFFSSSVNSTAYSLGSSYNDPRSAPYYMTIAYSNTAASYLWTPGFSLSSGVSYDFSFYFGGDGFSGWTGDIVYNTTQNSTGATALGASFITTGTTSSNATYSQISRTFVAPSTGVYYFAIKVVSTFTPFNVGFDDFSLALTPACAAQPSSLSSSSITTTTATISWTAASPAPSSGYEYYVSTSSTAPTAGSSATGTVGAGVTTASLTGLTAQTPYYFWVRSVCGADKSAWAGSGTFTTACAVNAANDLCSSAIQLTVGGAATSGTLNCASQETPFINDFCSVYGYCGSDVWYKFTPTCNGNYTINLTGMSRDYELYIYTACGSSSYFTSGETISTTSESVTFNGVSGTTYYIQVYDYDELGGSFSINVTANSTYTATPSVINGPINVCPSTTGLTYSVTNVTGTSYAWTLPSGWTGSSTSNSINLTSGTTGGNVSVIATLLGCPASTSVAVPVSIKPLPTAVSATATPATVCSGSNTNLTSSAVAPPTTTLLSCNVSDITGWWTNNGTYVIVASANNAGGTAPEFRFLSSSTNPTNLDLTLNAPGYINATGYSSLTLTFKHKINYYAAPCGPFTVETSPDNSTWTARWTLTPTANVAATTATVDLSALAGQNFYIRWRFNGNAYNYDTWRIDDISISGVPSMTYTWASAPSGFTSSVQNPGSTSLSQTSTYTVSASGGGCTATNSVLVTVRDAFTSGTILSTGETICSGGDPALIGSSTSASGGDASITYKWQANGVDIASSNSATYDPPLGLTATTTYTRWAKDGTCNTSFTQSTGSWVVTVRDAFTSGTILSTGETICSGGDPAIIGSSTAASGGDASITYKWQANGVDIASSNSATYDPPSGLTATTTYTRWAKDGTCNTSFTQSTGSWVVTVTSAPAASVSLGSSDTDNTICAGTSVTFTATPTNGGTPSYQWKKNGSVIAGETGSTYTTTGLANNDAITVVMTSTATCVTGSPYTSSGITTTVNALPTATASVNPTTACLGQTVTLTGVSGTFSYSWSGPSGATISDASVQSPTVTMGATSGAFTLTVTNSNGCTASASTASVTSGTPNVAGLTAGDVLWSGINSADWNTNTNWVVYNGGNSYSIANAAPQTSTSVKIPTTGTCVVNSPEVTGTRNANDVTILSGATLTVTGTLNVAGNVSINETGTLDGNGTINVANGWVNNGTFNAGTGSVVFNGGVSSTIGGSGTNTFYNLAIAKSSNAFSATISNNITVSNQFTLTTGKWITGTNTIIVSNAASNAVSGGGASSYVQGRLRRAVAGANTYVFPVGQSLYEEASLAFSTGYTSADITAFFTDGSPGNLPAGGLTQSGTPLTGILNKGYWSIDPSNAIGSPTYTVTVKETGHSNGATSATQYTVIKRSNSPSVGDWTIQGTHSNTTQADVGGLVTAVRSGLTSFSDFAIAYGGGALPIELTSFQANCSDNNSVDITWSTASEHNTNYFRVDKSRDGMQWDVLNTIGAAGNSNYTIDYALTDAFPNPGINYYRLTQYDNDGVFETFDTQAAVCKDQQSGTALSSYPNPSSGDFNVDLQTDELEGEATLLITDAKGAVVHSQDIKIIKGNNNFVIQKFNAEPGIYYITVKAGVSTVTTKHSMR